MRDLHRKISAHRLRNAGIVRKRECRRVPAVASVGEDHPVGRHGADRLNRTFHSGDVSFFRHVRRLVDEIEGKPLLRNGRIALREEGPVLNKGAARVLAALEQLLWLEVAPVDAVAWRAVKAHLNVEPVLPAELDRAVNWLHPLLVDAVPVAAVGPVAVVDRKAHEVEAPLLDLAEVRLAVDGKLRLLVPYEHLKEVESPPAFGGTPGRPTLGSYCRSPVFARLRWLAEGLAHGHHRRNGQQ